MSSFIYTGSSHRGLSLLMENSVKHRAVSSDEARVGGHDEARVWGVMMRLGSGVRMRLGSGGQDEARVWGVMMRLRSGGQDEARVGGHDEARVWGVREGRSEQEGGRSTFTLAAACAGDRHPCVHRGPRLLRPCAPVPSAGRP